MIAASAATRIRRPNCLAALVTAVTCALAVLSTGGVAVADQTVYHDEAGDAPHVGLIGDSTLTGVRWYADYGDLERFNFVYNAESCRRTIEASCISREGYRSENVISTMRSLDGELGEVLVIMSGYNDPISTIDEAIDGVVAEARQQGIGQVVWLSLRTGDDVDYSDPQEQSSIDTFREYNDLLFEAADDSDGYLQIADWDAYSRGADGWFEYDGVHLTAAGVDQLTSYLATTIDRVLAGENVTPEQPLWVDMWPGAEGDDVVAVQEALLAADIELAGGVDGSYGDATVAAVADFQRRSDSLNDTGVVDEATARALGLFDEALVDSTPGATIGGTLAESSGEPVAADPTSSPAVTQPDVDEPTSRSLAPIVLAATGFALVLLALMLRRRFVLRARRNRRWARVHPSTSPHVSVADLRRSGELPRIGSIYDHETEPADEPATQH